MRTLLLLAAVLGCALPAPAGAGLPGGVTGTTCGLVGIYEETANFGNPATVSEAMFAAVTARDATERVVVTCELRINWNVVHSVSSSPDTGPVAVLPPDFEHVELPDLDLVDDVQVCTEVSVSGLTSTTCKSVVRTGAPPATVCEVDVAGCDGDEAQLWYLVPDPVTE